MGTAPEQTMQEDRRRAPQRRRRAGMPASWALALAAAAIVAAVMAVAIWSAASPGGTAGHPGAGARYGGLPAWLPRPKVKVDRVLHGSPGHPAVSVQGEPVLVSTASGSVLATGVGPEVPEEGRFPVPAVTPTTFLVTFARASAPIRLRQGQFALLDERGSAHQPHVTSLSGGPMPAIVAPGQSVTVKLHAIIPTGNGALTWAPQGRRPSAAWDYTVEVD